MASNIKAIQVCSFESQLRWGKQRHIWIYLFTSAWTRVADNGITATRVLHRRLFIRSWFTTIKKYLKKCNFVLHHDKKIHMNILKTPKIWFLLVWVFKAMSTSCSHTIVWGVLMNFHANCIIKCNNSLNFFSTKCLLSWLNSKEDASQKELFQSSRVFLSAGEFSSPAEWTEAFPAAQHQRGCW